MITSGYTLDLYCDHENDLGHYGLDYLDYVNLLEARWKELILGNQLHSNRLKT